MGSGIYVQYLFKLIQTVHVVLFVIAVTFRVPTRHIHITDAQGWDRAYLDCHYSIAPELKFFDSQVQISIINQCHSTISSRFLCRGKRIILVNSSTMGNELCMSLFYIRQLEIKEPVFLQGKDIILAKQLTNICIISFNILDI